MLQLLGLILLFFLAFDTTNKIYRERAIFRELNQTTFAMCLVWLYPVPLLLPYLDRHFWSFFFPLPIAELFFVPAMLLALINRRCFDRSGDDRVKPAAAAVDHLITFGIMGIMGTLLITILMWSRAR